MSSDLRQKITAICKQLDGDELRVVHLIAARMLGGQPVYGVLNIDTDPRNWTREAREEWADALIYSTIDRLKKSVALDDGEP